MVISPTPPTPVPAAAERPAIIFVALELSKARWLVGIHAPVADRISRHSVAGGDSRALLELSACVRRRTERQLGRPAAVVCCYEAGYDGFWLHRLLCAGGIENHVIDPASLPVDRRARRAKADRIDLAALLRALIAWKRGETQVCRMVRVPGVEDEDRRRRSRERERLINERVQHIGRIKGLLMTQGASGISRRRGGTGASGSTGCAPVTAAACRRRSRRRSRASAAGCGWSST